MFVSNENENKQLFDEDFHQKILANGGVQLYFSNVFSSNGEDKLPTIKHKLRKILVDYGLCQTHVEINQSLDFIKVWYKDEQATKLKELFVPLQRYNSKKRSQAIELVIDLEGSLVISPNKEGKIKTYTGLTKLLFQEFIEEPKSSSMLDDNPYDEMNAIIRKGNLAPTEPLSSILAKGVV